MIENFITTLNTSKYFSGIMMLLLNVGGKHISKELSFLQDSFLDHKIIRRLLIFVVVFIATKDVKISFLITVGFIILVTGVLNEESKYCILPKDKFNKDIKITKSEYLNAKEIIKYYEKQNNS